MFILFETLKFDKENQRNYLFQNPVTIIECYKLKDIEECFFKLESALKKGYSLAGFLSYEAGYAFEERLSHLIGHPTFPFIYFGVFKEPTIIDKNCFRLEDDSKSYQIDGLNLNTKKEDYIASIEKIKDLIKAGDTYQVNYTIKYKFNFRGSPYTLYSALKNNQSVSYAAFIEAKDFTILCLSPELFFRKKGEIIKVKPMKGTIARGRNLEEDSINASILKNDIKNQSENIMIVDLLRNDLGRISKTGSVKVVNLFEIEKYETLFQMVSTVKSKIKQDIPLYDLFKSLFPSGSVTGAPKIRTMEIIKSLEKEERKIYTGSIGFITPEKDMVFNVAIRTVLLKGNKGEMGIGSGIVYDSNPEAEFEECKLKANFLTSRRPQFQLIETMFYAPTSGFPFLEYHMRRLRNSAQYFDFLFDEKFVRGKLGKLVLKMKTKVRLLLSKNGEVDISATEIAGQETFENLIALSEFKTSSKDPFLFHKTTNRKLYDEEYNKYKERGFFDVIFQNEKGEITEGAISNIFIKRNGIYYTPKIECGLLDGVYRRYFINKNRNIIEGVLSKDDLIQSDEIYLTNAVRGLVKAKLNYL